MEEVGRGRVLYEGFGCEGRGEGEGLDTGLEGIDVRRENWIVQ